MSNQVEVIDMKEQGWWRKVHSSPGKSRISPLEIDTGPSESASFGRAPWALWSWIYPELFFSCTVTTIKFKRRYISENVATSHFGFLFVFFCFQMQNSCFELSLTRLGFCHKFTSSWLGKNSSYLLKNLSRSLIFWIQTTIMTCLNNMPFCSGVLTWSAFHLFEDERKHLLKQTKKIRLSNYFWSGGGKKCLKMHQVSHASDGFVCLRENVWVWWRHQLVQPERSKTLHDLHGVAPARAEKQG